MAEGLLDLGNGFWNIRGDFRLAGLVNVGTHASLVRLGSGRFVLLDSYSLTGALRDRVMALTDGGRAVEAILNLHPFHTLHCEAMHRDFPDAALYGTARHRQRLPALPWADAPVESGALAARYADDLVLSVPAGIDLVCAAEHVHAGSVLAWHKSSGTLHVDDTLNLVPVPRLLRGLLPPPRLFLHPTLPQALAPGPGAVRDFRAWVKGLAVQCADLRHLVVAHSGHRSFAPGAFADALLTALRRASPRLERAEARRGTPAA